MSETGGHSGFDHSLDEKVSGESKRRTIPRVPESAQDVSVAIVVLIESYQHFIIDLRHPHETASAAAADRGHTAPRFEVRQRRDLHLHSSLAQGIEVVGD